MYVVFPLIYALAKLQRKNAILVHSPIFFYLWAIICVLLKAEPSSYAQQLCVSNNRRTR